MSGERRRGPPPRRDPRGASRPGAGDARRPAAPVDAGSEAAGVSAALLDAAVAATTTLLAFNQPADAALSGFFRAHRSGGRDRAFIAETAYAVLRRKRLLERLA